MNTTNNARTEIERRKILRFKISVLTSRRCIHANQTFLGVIELVNKKKQKKPEIMPFLSLSFFCPIVTILIPPKGDSPDSNCQFKCCFLFVAFTVLSFSFLFVFFSMLFVHRKKKFFLAAIAITPHKHTIAHPPTIVIM